MIARLAFLAFLVAGTAAADQEEAQVRIAAGKTFAQRWCTGCHVVGPGIPGGTVGPAFFDIAQRPGKSAGKLFNWMIAPHPPMPDLELSEIESDLVAD